MVIAIFDYLGDASGETATPDITVNVYSSDPALGGATLIATFTAPDNDVVVTGLKQGYYIEITSSDPFLDSRIFRSDRSSIQIGRNSD